MCNTTDGPHRCSEINVQMTEDEYYVNKHSNPNPTTDHNKGYIINYFLLGPKREADIKQALK